MRLLRYLSAFVQVRKEISEQRKWNQTFLVPYINSLEKKFNGTFPAAQLKKILNYYGLFITSILCSSYKRLYSKTLTEAERKRSSLFGILTPIGDDLFDIDKLDTESIRTITFTPEQYIATTFSASVATEIQAFLLQNVPHKKAYTEASKNVFEIQLETIKQTNPAITNSEIETITYAKGGYSVIIYHQALDDTASPEMLKALFHIGSLMQFANDCFDIYKDIHDGIFTLASRCNDYRQIKKLYLQRVKETNRLIYALPYSENKKQEFCIIMHSVIAQGLVAIDRMIKLQDKLGAPVDCLKLERAQLICDMQKPANVARWIYYAIRLPWLR